MIALVFAIFCIFLVYNRTCKNMNSE